MRQLAFGLVLTVALPATQAWAQASPSDFTSGTRYDAARRVVGTIAPDPDGAGSLHFAATRSSYDALGRLTRVEKGELSSWQDQRMTAKDIPGGTSADVYYGYDLRGLQLYARFVSSTGVGITNSYDGFSRLITTANDMSGTAKTLSYQWDADGNRTRITHPDSVYFTYDHDGLDRTTAIKENGSTTIVSDAYDNQGRRASETRGAVTTTYAYDPVSRLASLSDDLAGTTNDVTSTFGYTPAGQIVNKTRSNDLYAFNGYVTLSRSYAANGLNQYDTAGPATFSYDANGNLTGDGTATYTYDVENRMLSKSTSGGGTTSLVYDPLGRLWHVVAPTKTMEFTYDGDALVYEVNGPQQARYVHGNGEDDPLIWYLGSGLTDRRSLQADAQGSIVSIADASGAELAINAYDEYGIPGSVSTRFAYTGQILLTQLGMYYYKARMYSPTLGRFMQTDPIGYDDQNNLYGYVGNDPIDGRDPSGKDCVSANGTTVCTTSAYEVSFPTQQGWKDPKSSDPNYHFYSEPAQSPFSKQDTQKWVADHPTPGLPRPATPQGTVNDATPGLGGISPISISPVKSFTTTNKVSGQPVVVNVTLPGHPLQSGIVVRQVDAGPNGKSTIQNWGEGNGSLQKPGATFADDINSVWKGLAPQVPAQGAIKGPCGPMRGACC